MYNEMKGVGGSGCGLFEETDLEFLCWDWIEPCTLSVTINGTLIETFGTTWQMYFIVKTYFHNKNSKWYVSVITLRILKHYIVVSLLQIKTFSL